METSKLHSSSTIMLWLLQAQNPSVGDLFVYILAQHLKHIYPQHHAIGEQLGSTFIAKTNTKTAHIIFVIDSQAVLKPIAEVREIGRHAIALTLVQLATGQNGKHVSVSKCRSDTSISLVHSAGIKAEQVVDWQTNPIFA